MLLLCNYTLICCLTEGVDEGHGGDGRALRDRVGNVPLENYVAAAKGTDAG